MKPEPKPEVPPMRPGIEAIRGCHDKAGFQKPHSGISSGSRSPKAALTAVSRSLHTL